LQTKQETLKKYAPRLIELIIDRWASLIIRESFFGIHRFDDFHKNLGIAPNILSVRLQRLIDAGIFKVVRYSNNPVRYEYHFTEMGRDLYPLIICIKYWGDKWMSQGYKPDEMLYHVDCGSTYVPVPVCSECGEKIEYGDVLYDAAIRKMAASKYRLIDTRKRKPSKLVKDIENVCSSERALNMVGDRWTFLIIREALLGVKRFDTFLEELDISRTILASRLKFLVSNNIMVKRRYSDHPPRYEYKLTQKGADFYPIGLATISWENKWLTGMGLPALSLKHKKCGKVFNSEIVCSHCLHEVTSKNTRSSKSVPSLQCI
jgi:DNA-binding HxlR family transcriptional regulator